MIELPLSEITFTFARSSGAGGQNVNKLNTKAVLRWAVSSSRLIPFDIKNRFLLKYHHRINAEGELILTSERFRVQAQNIDDCLAKLADMLSAIEHPPKPRKRTKPTKASVRKRLDSKRRQKDKKTARRKLND